MWPSHCDRVAARKINVVVMGAAVVLGWLCKRVSRFYGQDEARKRVCPRMVGARLGH